MITEFFLVAVVNYIQARVELDRPDAAPPKPTRDAAWLLTSTLYKEIKTEREMLLFVALAEVESKFYLMAENKRSKAFGPLQVMPMHMKGHEDEVVWSIKAGVKVYRDFYRQFKHHLTALAHYNGGYRNAKRQECRDYAHRVMNLYNKLYRNWITRGSLS